MEKALPAIPAKRYFTIGEVSDLCGVKPYVLRYWEQEFTQLKPMKRRGNRRYYQHHEVLLIRRIRDLLYEQGFTISGARNRLSELSHGSRHDAGPDTSDDEMPPVDVPFDDPAEAVAGAAGVAPPSLRAEALARIQSAAMIELPAPAPDRSPISAEELRRELAFIRQLLDD